MSWSIPVCRFFGFALGADSLPAGRLKVIVWTLDAMAVQACIRPSRLTQHEGADVGGAALRQALSSRALSDRRPSNKTRTHDANLAIGIELEDNVLVRFGYCNTQEYHGRTSRRNTLVNVQLTFKRKRLGQQHWDFSAITIHAQRQVNAVRLPDETPNGTCTKYNSR